VSDYSYSYLAFNYRSSDLSN